MRSPDSITSLASARSTSSRSSASVAKGPSVKPLPGVSAFPIMMSSRGNGPSTVVIATIGPAAAQATRSACWRPSVRGATPHAMNETMIMMPAVTAPACHVFEM